MRLPRCPKTGKPIYPHRMMAERTARRCEKNRPQTPIRVFACPDCKGWHLTSLPFWKQISVSDAVRRQVAAEQGIEIEQQETEYLRKRLRETTAELTEYWENLVLEAFKESLDRRAQQKTLKELGVK